MATDHAHRYHLQLTCMTGLRYRKKQVVAAATSAVAARPSAASKPGHVTVTVAAGGP